MGFVDKVESWEVIGFIGCLLFLTLYFGQQMDWENMFKSDSDTPVHMGALTTNFGNLSQVEVHKIPDSVYASLETDPTFKRYLTGNHKYVYLFTYPGCRYARAFSNAFERLFNEDGYGDYYRKRIHNVGRSFSVSCPGLRDMNCATAWVYQTCLGKLCIFNPQRREVVVDASQNAQQIEPLLEKYKEW